MKNNRDEKALHRLISAYMRLAISMASKFKRYGAPMSDLIQEAGLGLMKALINLTRTVVCGSPPTQYGGSKRVFKIMLCVIGLW